MLKPVKPPRKHDRYIRTVLELLGPISIIRAMANFYGPADRPEDWQQLLAKPDQHWRTGYSAKSVAYSWTEARGFPTEVNQALYASDISALTGLEFLLGFPEYEVPLPGGKRSSQNDVFVLAKGDQGLVTIAVEGKVAEPFDLPVGERFAAPTPGQTQRLEYLCKLLQVDRDKVDHVGYQLFHRSASAVIEAQRFGANHALMLVHSFSKSLQHFDDFYRFAQLYDLQAEPDDIQHAATLDGVELYLSWVVGDPKYLKR